MLQHQYQYQSQHQNRNRIKKSSRYVFLFILINNICHYEGKVNNPNQSPFSSSSITDLTSKPHNSSCSNSNSNSNSNHNSNSNSNSIFKENISVEDKEADGLQIHENVKFVGRSGRKNLGEGKFHWEKKVNINKKRVRRTSSKQLLSHRRLYNELKDIVNAGLLLTTINEGHENPYAKKLFQERIQMEQNKQTQHFEGNEMDSPMFTSSVETSLSHTRMEMTETRIARFSTLSSSSSFTMSSSYHRSTTMTTNSFKDKDNKDSIRSDISQHHFVSDDSNDYIRLAPIGDNLYEWHFTIAGPSGSVYESGLYHGRILLPIDYPLTAPRIQMLTPSGRFQTKTDLCLSASNYHQETWQPQWTLRTLVSALRLHMITNAQEIGGIESKEEVKLGFAKASRRWKCDKCGCCHQNFLPNEEGLKQNQAIFRKLPRVNTNSNQENEKARFKMKRGHDNLEDETLYELKETETRMQRASPRISNPSIKVKEIDNEDEDLEVREEDDTKMYTKSKVTYGFNLEALLQEDDDNNNSYDYENDNKDDDYNDNDNDEDEDDTIPFNGEARNYQLNEDNDRPSNFIEALGNIFRNKNILYMCLFMIYFYIRFMFL